MLARRSTPVKFEELWRDIVAARWLTMVFERAQGLTEAETRLGVRSVMSLGERIGRRRAPKVHWQWRHGGTSSCDCCCGCEQRRGREGAMRRLGRRVASQPGYTNRRGTAAPTSSTYGRHMAGAGWVRRVPRGEGYDVGRLGRFQARPRREGGRPTLGLPLSFF